MKSGTFDNKLGMALFLCSLSTISFEIALTRVFSIALWYHFASMVISIAMMGLGLSGTVLSLYPRLKDAEKLGSYALSLGISLPVGYVLTNLVPLDPARLSWDIIQLLYVALYYLILCVPFFFFGLLISTSFSVMKEKAGLIYGADLLGAGAGSIIVLLLMGQFGAVETVFISSSGAIAGAFLLGRRRASLSIILIIPIAMLMFPNLAEIRISPYKALETALRYPGAELINTYQNGFTRIDLFHSPMARFAPGLSLKYLEELPEQIGFSVDGSNINAITEDDRTRTEFLRYLPSALPYETGKRPSVLAVDPKGGLPVLLSRTYGSGTVYSIESSPLLTDIIHAEYDKFSGSVYSENTWIGLARIWLRGRNERFNLIDISLMEASPSQASGMSEDYRYTVEAFGEYLSHLTEEGVISISLYILPPPRIEFRLLATAVRAMEEMGIENAKEHIAAIRSWGSICMLFKKTPLSQDEIKRLKAFSRSRNFDLVYYPGISEEETNIFVQMPTNEYHKAFTRLVFPDSRRDFIDNYIFDISEVYDDRPFFHFYLKPENIKETYNVMGRKWQFFIEEGYLLPVVFAQALVLSLIILILPALRKFRHSPSSGYQGPVPLHVNPVTRLSYFAFLGLGFMFIEIPMIQRMILPLENPSYAIAVVLASILVSSGAGSLLSHRYSMLGKPLVVLFIALIALPYALLFSAVLEYISTFQMIIRIIFSSALIMPMGFFIGIPFPLGIRSIHAGLVPWAWATNGCFSVLAPMLSAMIAMTAGFRTVLILGAGMYALAYMIGSLTLFRGAAKE